MTLIGRDVLVVGGGIAGMSIARAFALRGASVRVLEQAAEITEVGAGIQISPNGGRVLEALGLAQAFAAVSDPSVAVCLKTETGDDVLRMDLAGRGRFGLVHRADLIEILHAGAREAGVEVVTGARVCEVAQCGAGAAVALEDGTKHRASLVIGAEGGQSPTRALLDGARTPSFTGQVAWRAVVPAPATLPREARVFMSAGRHVVLYPLRGGTLLNIVAVEERSEWTDEGWHHMGDPDAMRASFRAFGGPVAEGLAAVETCGVWGLHRHPVARAWHAPGVALVGDAAHPTLPFLAQGACMALEDAWALVRAFAGHDEDAAALAAYQAARRPRAVRIVNAATANARNYHLSGVRRVAAHTALRVLNSVAPGLMLSRFDWLYGYDATA